MASPAFHPAPSRFSTHKPFPNTKPFFKLTPSNFGGTEATFNENYCLKVRFWKDKTDVPARLYCGNSRTCLERPRADNGDVVTEINPYWMDSYHYDGKTDPETIACPAKEDGRQSSSSESDFEQAAGLKLEWGNEYIVPALKVDNLPASSFQPKGGDTATETPTFDLVSNTAESPPLIDAIHGAALPPIFAGSAAFVSWLVGRCELRFFFLFRILSK